MKSINFKLAKNFWVIALLGASMAMLNSCADYMQGVTFIASDDKMIDEYIEQKDTSMTEFLKIADVAGFRGLLHAYGTNTCFIPTNQAIYNYCQSRGIASFCAELDESVLLIVPIALAVVNFLLMLYFHELGFRWLEVI